MVQRYPPKARGTITWQSPLVTVLLSSLGSKPRRGRDRNPPSAPQPLVIEAGIETLTHRRHHNLRQQLGDQQDLVMRGKAW